MQMENAMICFQFAGSNVLTKVNIMILPQPASCSSSLYQQEKGKSVPWNNILLSQWLAYSKTVIVVALLL